MTAGSLPGPPHRPVRDPELASKLARVDREAARMRQNIFRMHAGRNVCLASPLLVDACRPSELDAAAWLIHPTRHWPERPTLRTMVRGRSMRGSAFSPVRVAVTGPDGKGAIVSDMLCLCLTDRAAHMILRVGDASLATTDDGGTLSLPWLLPEEERAIMVGGPLDRVFEHLATVRGEYVVRSATIDASRGRTVVSFAAAPLEWRLPWARPWNRVRSSDAKR